MAPPDNVYEVGDDVSFNNYNKDNNNIDSKNYIWHLYSAITNNFLIALFHVFESL